MLIPASRHGGGGRSDQVLLRDYDATLGAMVGCLSHYIIKKKYDLLSIHGRPIGPAEARTLTDMVVEEATALIGPVKAEELKRRLDDLNERYLGKGDKA